MGNPEARGIRNNNPGNIRNDPANLWHGQTGIDGKGFCTFYSMASGVRALLMILHNKYYRDGLVTIEQIVSSYAPPTENNTPSYITAVATGMGRDPNAMLSPPSDMGMLAAHILRHESGFTDYTPAVLQGQYNNYFQAPKETT